MLTSPWPSAAAILLYQLRIIRWESSHLTSCLWHCGWHRCHTVVVHIAVWRIATVLSVIQRVLRIIRICPNDAGMSTRWGGCKRCRMMIYSIIRRCRRVEARWTRTTLSIPDEHRNGYSSRGRQRGHIKRFWVGTGLLHLVAVVLEPNLYL